MKLTMTIGAVLSVAFAANTAEAQFRAPVGQPPPQANEPPTANSPRLGAMMDKQKSDLILEKYGTDGPLKAWLYSKHVGAGKGNPSSYLPTRKDFASAVVQGDLVTHDAKKFFGLLLKKNGYVLEQVYSPLIVHTTPEHEELKEIAKGCITTHHSHHYFGFAETQWKLFEKERPRRVKPLLYVYRVLLTGIHLMRTGEVEANLVRLNEEARLSHVADLIERKLALAGPEKSVLDDSDVDFHHREYHRLRWELEVSYQASSLPEAPTARDGPERPSGADPAGSGR